MIRDVDLSEISDGKLYRANDMVKVGTGDWAAVQSPPAPAISAVSDADYTVSWSNLPDKTAASEPISYAATETLPSDSYYKAVVGSTETAAGNETV